MFSAKNILKIGFLWIAASGSVSFAVTEAEFAKAINVAGRQRMLSQRMAKEAFLIDNKVKVEDNQKALRATIDLFDESLKNLMDGNKNATIPAPPDDKVAKELGKVKGLWAEYHCLLATMLPDNLKNDTEKACKVDASKAVETIATQSLPILKTMNSAVKKYEVASVKAGIKGKGKVINIAGRQRMLTQKMAKEALLITKGVDRMGNQKALTSTLKLFSTSLDALINGSKSMRIAAPPSPEVKAQLEVVAKHWKQYEPLMKKALAGSGKLDAGELATLNDLSTTILKDMHKAVGMYE